MKVLIIWENKQTIIYDEQARTNKQTDEQAQGPTDLGMNMVKWQVLCTIAPVRMLLRI